MPFRSSPAVRRLRRHALRQSLFAPVSLTAAIAKLGFVQADPIRAPARAQDLILRHRVHDYRVGDLERQYADLDVDEDLLYAYGFLSRPVGRWLHPRPAVSLTALEQRVYATVRDRGPLHPAELEPQFGSRRVVNAWGGFSKATTHALERLHQRGLLRVAGRKNGIRIYEARPASDACPTAERWRQIILAVVKILSPVSLRCLRQALTPIRRLLPPAEPITVLVRSLVLSGTLRQETVAGVVYLMDDCDSDGIDVTPVVRLLAPFDPVVWDRVRFEQFWGWAYRFEAYTPVAKRVRGYYALPLLWADQVIGWANSAIVGGQLDIQLGFVRSRPRSRQFRIELERELARFETFLNLPAGI
ncbi:MAG: YcaQ family DNA glycosylase [Planctomycetes bacterium]|nr:YcaQ family DNA glycosylase [Planctomycetota bacterium]